MTAVMMHTSPSASSQMLLDDILSYVSGKGPGRDMSRPASGQCGKKRIVEKYKPASMRTMHAPSDTCTLSRVLQGPVARLTSLRLVYGASANKSGSPSPPNTPG